MTLCVSSRSLTVLSCAVVSIIFSHTTALTIAPIATARKVVNDGVILTVIGSRPRVISESATLFHAPKLGGRDDARITRAA